MEKLILYNKIKFMMKNYPRDYHQFKDFKELKNDIEYNTKEFDKFNSTIIERVFAFINDINDRPKCPECNKYVKYAPGIRWSKFCSNKCGSIYQHKNMTNEEKLKRKEKIKNTWDNKSTKEKETIFKNYTWDYIKKYQSSIEGQKIGHIYVIRLFNEDETFFKLGITSTPIKNRYFGLSYYSYEILEDVLLTNLKCAILEKKLHKKHKHLKYKPKYNFGGHTECYSRIIKIKGYLK